MTIVLLHGAGSSGSAASALLGPLAPYQDGSEIHRVEDRTGDVARVEALLDEALTINPACTTIVGVSLGAHAVARWAARASRSPGRKPSDVLPRLICVLPAWSGQPGDAASATSAAAQAVESQGIESVLDRLSHEGRHPDVVDLLRVAWAEYSDESLARCLRAASEGHGPTPEELASIDAPVTVVGWFGDAFHPASVARDWGRCLRWPTIALAVRPEIGLLRRALATVGLRRTASRSPDRRM